MRFCWFVQVSGFWNEQQGKLCSYWRILQGRTCQCRKHKELICTAVFPKHMRLVPCCCSLLSAATEIQACTIWPQARAHASFATTMVLWQSFCAVWNDMWNNDHVPCSLCLREDTFVCCRVWLLEVLSSPMFRKFESVFRPCN